MHSRLLLLGFFLCFGLFAVRGQAVLQNTATGKAKILKKGGDISLRMNLPGMGLSSGYRQLTGRLDTTSNKLLKLIPVKEEKRMEFPNGLVKMDEANYTQLKGIQPLAVPVAGIQQLAYRSQSTRKINEWATVLTFLGALNALVVAPLASIDYGEGAFNSDNYFRWAGYSLGATGLGVAVMLGTKKRKFDIRQPEQAATGGLWEIR